MSDIELIEAPARTAAPARRRPSRAGRPMAAFPVMPAVRARLAAMAGQVGHAGTALPLDDDDALRPVRGIALALLMVTPFWAAVTSAVWALLR